MDEKLTLLEKILQKCQSMLNLEHMILEWLSNTIKYVDVTQKNISRNPSTFKDKKWRRKYHHHPGIVENAIYVQLAAKTSIYLELIG